MICETPEWVSNQSLGQEVLNEGNEGTSKMSSESRLSSLARLATEMGWHNSTTELMTSSNLEK